jgi:iron complex outermembrane recepter protein
MNMGAWSRKALLVAGSAVCAMATPASAQAKQFDIPAQAVETATAILARQAGVQIVAARQFTRGKQSNAVRGVMTAQQALNRMLDGTGLRAQQSGPETFVVIGPRQSARDGNVRRYAAQPSAPEATAPSPQDQLAPASDADAPASDQASDIVVTGTLIRGIAPTGTNSIGITRDVIRATGATSTVDLLASVPQVTNLFNNIRTGTAVLGTSTVRPNIRNLGSSAGSTTLLLLNGRRLVGSGIGSSSDPTFLPPSVMERVDVIPDGASSIYGSDAIGGVINFVTRKRFDGVQAEGYVGTADNYTTAGGTLTAGRDWGSGSVYAAYSYDWHDNIVNSERDYIHPDNRPFGGSDLRASTCAPGNITTGGVTYALPGRLPGNNRCDEGGAADFYPREERQTVFASLTQNLSDAITIDLTGFYNIRRLKSLGFGDSSGRAASGTIRSSNPYFQPIGTESSQNVAFSLAPALGAAAENRGTYETYGMTPSIAFDLNSNFQLRVSGNYGRNSSVLHQQSPNGIGVAAGLAGTTTATALNPYDVTLTDPAVLASIRNYEILYTAKQDLIEARAVLDGTLLTLPGGDVRIAVGAEYHYEDLNASMTTGRPSQNDRFVRRYVDRKVKSLFGEVVVPLFGPDNATPGIQALTLNGSVRYDSYSDAGSTTNPKIGIDYKPFEDLRIRGTWGTSFHAPSLNDQGGAPDSRVEILSSSNRGPASSLPANVNRSTLRLAGGNPNLKPEDATTWSVGADYRPAYVPGLSLSLTYFNVNFTNAIANGSPSNPIFFTNPAFANLYVLEPTLQQALAAAGDLPLDGAASIQSLYQNGNSPYILLDLRRYNLAAVKTDGLDFNGQYNRATSFGSINLAVGGTYILNRKSQPTPVAVPVDDLANGTSRFSIAGSAGAKVGSLTGRVAVNHTGGYPVLNVIGQSRVSSFTTVDLFAAYDFTGGGMLSDVSLTLNVRNLFDQDPPYFNSLAGYANGGTLGRFFQIGLRKKF